MSKKLPVLKMLSTPSCPACVQMAHVLDELNTLYGAEVRGERVDLSQNMEMARQYNVRYVPHLLFVNSSGEVVKEAVGVLSLKEVLETFRGAGVAL